jgi:hypothetical protein
MGKKRSACFGRNDGGWERGGRDTGTRSGDGERRRGAEDVESRTLEKLRVRHPGGDGKERKSRSLAGSG